MEQIATELAQMRQQMLQNQQHMTEMGEALALTRAENQRLHQMVEGGIGSLPTIATSLGEAVTRMGNASSSPGSRKVDNFIAGSFGEDFRKALVWAVEQDDCAKKAEWGSVFGDGGDEEFPEAADHISQVYTLLVALTDEDSNDIVVGSGSGEGLEAWRRLHRRWGPSTGGRKRTLLKAIISPPRCAITELAGRLERWQQQVSKYERKKDSSGAYEVLKDDLKMAALEFLVPEDIENHLVLNKHRLATYEATLAEAPSILEARVGVKLKGTPTPWTRQRHRDLPPW